MTSMSPYKQCDLELFLHLQPRYLGALTQGVYEQLGKLLMLYHDDLGGVAVAFSRVALKETAGVIMADDPRIHVHVTARATVFAPPVGCLLRGTVNKLSPDHIGLLVHDAFNAAIGRAHMPADLVYDADEQVWNRTDPAVPIAVGSSLQLAVMGLEEANGVMSIVCSILPEHLPPTNTAGAPAPAAAAAAQCVHH